MSDQLRPRQRGKEPKPPREPKAPKAQRAPKADGDVDAPKGGILGAIRAHPTAWLVSALTVAFVLLGTGAVFAGVAYGSTSAAAETPEPEETQDPPRPQPSAIPTTADLRTCSIVKLTKDPRLMTMVGSVARADTGEILYSYGAVSAERTGSVLKVLTASAAIIQLGADYQIKTSVVAGSTPGSIVLVGRGDATLSAMPPGTESVYAGAPKLSSLAAAVIAKYSATYPGQQITSLVLDATYWSTTDKWDKSWARSEQTIGYHSEVTALQVDGDRADPTKQTSPRSTDPIGRAGKAFLQALRDADSGGIVAADVTISTGAAAGGTLLGEVKSQPLRVLIKQMLLNSDNTLAEMLARIVSKQGGLGGSAASLQQAIPSLLWPNDSTTASRVRIVDGSGLSENNGVPANTMAQFMRRVQAGSDNLDIVRDALPVAGKSGTLASRFTGDNAVARGHVTAKTGWIDTAYTLAGFMDAADGTILTFAFYAIGPGIKDNAKEALDTVVTGVYKCGENLAAF
ncbi:MAG: D-alanyl-D-alanine carboxypeptidase/D-alanyl-D-alanine-endopeptidase [Schumannella sp.]|nr:D-alanyl-D-alanine carboxypeptidase/D-alanyl-D-alanine-endopeptidase [Microbacteriaceae bacterium]